MQDTWLITLSLGVSSLGIVGLLLLLLFLEPGEAGPGAVAEGGHVRFQGSVSSVQHRGNVTILSVQYPEVVDVVVFQDVPVNATCVEIRGKKSSYKGQEQVTATKILGCDP